jgi:cysteine desulfurase/selenocysteine lyase
MVFHRPSYILIVMSTLSAYLNYASLGPLLPSVKCAVVDFLDLWQTGFSYYPTLSSVSDQVRQRVADLIDAKPDDIALQPNVATSFSLLVHAWHWEPGDEVVLLTEEFPSVTLPFVENQKKYGYRVRFITYTAFLQDPLGALADVVTAKTRWVVMSWVGYMSGCVAPIGDILTYCRFRGIRLGVDATQGVGVMPMSMRQTPVDFWAASTYKGLFAPVGVSLLYVSVDLRGQLSAVMPGWLSARDPSLMGYDDLDTPSGACRFENGGRSLLSMVGVNAAVQTLGTYGWDAIWAQTQDRRHALEQGLSARGMSFFGGVGLARAGILSVAHARGTEMAHAFAARRVMITHRNGLLRFSVHAFTKEAELAYFWQVLDDVLAEISPKK